MTTALPLYTFYTSADGQRWILVCDDTPRGAYLLWRQAMEWASNPELSFSYADAAKVVYDVAGRFEECQGE